MGQEAELSELRQRVEAVGARFSEVAEDSRRRGDRLANLLDQVEEGVVRGRREIDRLSQELADSREENAQLQDLLQRVLAEAEKVEGPGERIVLCDLEARVHRLCDQAAAMNGALNGALNDFANGAEGSDGSDRSGGLGTEALKASVNGSGEGAEKGARAADGAGPGRTEPVPDEALDDEADSERAVRAEDDGAPLELTRMIDEGGARKDASNDAGGPVAMDARPVQDIFKRVSMMTGRLRET